MSHFFLDRLRFVLLILSALPAAAWADGPDAVNLTAEGLEAWRKPSGDWREVGGVAINPENPRLLVGEPGRGVIYNGPAGRTTNLFSKDKFSDVEAHFEFLIPKGVNAGVKFEGLYEVQIFDSYGRKQPTASDCGGIYPRAELLPRYHYLDDGYPPKVNAALPPGEWQTLDVIFHAPKFDRDGKKVANARLCVQKRLMCSAGVRPAGGRAENPVAGMAGRRETDCPEAHRHGHPRDGRRVPGP